MAERDLTEEIVNSFKGKVESDLRKRLESFYFVGSYVFGGTSSQRPDINFLLIFKKRTTPGDYLGVGKICRSLEEEFSGDATIRVEFRPFRYLKPRHERDFEVSINPILISTDEIKEMSGVIFSKWFTEGLKDKNKLIFGSDFLETLEVDAITRDDLKRGALFDLMFFTIPVSRAPAQYSPAESRHLLNESLANAKNIVFLGVEVAMADDELKQKLYLDYVKEKGRVVRFYNERYSENAGRMVQRVLQVRDRYLEFRDDPETAEEIFSIALRLGNLVRKKLRAG